MSIVVKIKEDGCEKCIQMHPIEKAATEEYGTEFLLFSVEFAAMHDDIKDYLSKRVVDESGELDLPCYLFFDPDGNITGHFTGLGTYHDISRRDPVLLD